MSHQGDLRINFIPDFFDVSRHPAIQDLLHLELSAELEDDPQARECLYERNLPIAASPILGRAFVIDATLAVGMNKELGASRQIVFEDGLMFQATATAVGHMVNLDVPTDSAGIAFKDYRPVVEDTEDDIELAQYIAQRTSAQENIELDLAWIPIKAVRRCAVQRLQEKSVTIVKDDYLAKSRAELQELGITYEVIARMLTA